MFISLACRLGHYFDRYPGTGVSEKHTTSTPKAVCSSETLVPTYKTTSRQDHNIIFYDFL
jgi:hypothetical protein